MNFSLIYAAIPRIACKGKCQQYCGPITAYPREAEHFEKMTGKEFPDAFKVITSKTKTCPLLDPLGRCSVYQNRPIICRLWGVVPRMACPHGCVAERMLTEEESRALLDATL